MSRHRLDPPRRVRPRYGRMAAAGLSVAVTMVALLGGIGILPLQSGAGNDDTTPASSHTRVTSGDDGGSASGAPGSTTVASDIVDPKALPAGGGTGRRVVFSKSAQRVWLVDAKESVRSTYLVSGSVTDNLSPGSYRVY